MLRLILLQYFDVTDEEILYIVTDRPDPRCVAGTKPTNTTMTKESIKVVTDRRDQYRRQVRLKRERTWLQCESLQSLAQLRLLERIGGFVELVMLDGTFEHGAHSCCTCPDAAMRPTPRRGGLGRIEIAHQWQSAALSAGYPLC